MIAISDYTNDWTATTAGTTDAFISYDGTGNHVVESYIWACVDDVADGQIEIAKAKDLYIKKERPKSNIHYAFVGNKLQIKNEGFVFPFRGSSKKDDVLQKWIFIKKNKVYSQGQITLSGLDLVGKLISIMLQAGMYDKVVKILRTTSRSKDDLAGIIHEIILK